MGWAGARPWRIFWSKPAFSVTPWLHSSPTDPRRFPTPLSWKSALVGSEDRGPVGTKRQERAWGFNCCCCCLVAQSCLILCDTMDCSPPGSSIHGIFQARVLEWVAISYSRGLFPTHGSNLHLLHWQADSLPLRHSGSPKALPKSPVDGSGCPEGLLDKTSLWQFRKITS